MRLQCSVLGWGACCLLAGAGTESADRVAGGWHGGRCRGVTGGGRIASRQPSCAALRLLPVRHPPARSRYSPPTDDKTMTIDDNDQTEPGARRLGARPVR
ncbi:hypothetical protein BDY21DRAFT_355714 [Lineolata rhizophorae]|uniref:Secreted protein n=1 Tax=Lineolata rhizophorae TaxID=578093 RepID=A0A6A6NPF8_9PEZI|nr:hypothetical protein BDY21DRAFT_355714 [Lineolata rhizophorae]